MEAAGQDVHQEPADELGRGQAHDRLPVTALDAVILPEECNSIAVGADQAVVRDRHAVGISAQVGENGLGAAEGWAKGGSELIRWINSARDGRSPGNGVDDPFGPAERDEPSPAITPICAIRVIAPIMQRELLRS